MNKTGLRVFFEGLFVFLWLVLACGAASVRWHFLPLKLGLLMAAVAVFLLWLYGVILLLLIIYWAIRFRPPGRTMVWGAVLGWLPVGILVVTVGVTGFQAPAIHDISTDLEQPPAFVAAAGERKKGENSIKYEGERIASIQRQYYPDITTRKLEEEPLAVFEAAKQVSSELGWRQLTVDTDKLRIESVARTPLLGFEDDIVIRIKSADGGSQVDIRSASRVGLGDLGANARRIRKFQELLAEKFAK